MEVQNLQIIARELSIRDFCTCTYVWGCTLNYCNNNNKGNDDDNKNNNDNNSNNNNSSSSSNNNNDDNNNNNNNNNTNRNIPNNKLDITICDNKQGTCMSIDVAIRGDKKMIKKE